MEDLFSLPIFFISFREALETGIIVSVLLAIIKRTISERDDPALHATMVRQVWLGTAAGILICVLMGVVIIGGVYGLAADEMGGAEDLWEAVFSLTASVVITIMGAVLLRVGKLQDKWRLKLAAAMSASSASHPSAASGAGLMDRIRFLSEKYALFLLPFITVLREGFEGVLFIAGVGIGLPASSIPLSVLAGLAVGSSVGLLIYRGSRATPIQYFLVLSTCLLYLVAAGLFSKGVWHLEANLWNQVVGGDAAELGSGPGSYDIRRSVWHVNCCNPYLNGGGLWGIFNAVLGWQNSATVGSVVSYNLYWIAVSLGFAYLTLKEKGRLGLGAKAARGKADDAAATTTTTVSDDGAEPDDHEPLLANPAR